MPHKHLTWEIDAYLNKRLSPAEWADVQAHLNSCHLCARELVEAQQLDYSLRQVLKAELGQPYVPAHVRHNTRQAIYGSAKGKTFRFGPIFGALATGAVMLLVAVGVFNLIQGQLEPDIPPSTAQIALAPTNTASAIQIAAPTATETLIVPTTPTEAVTADIIAPTNTPLPLPTETSLPAQVLSVEQTAAPPTEIPTTTPTELPAPSATPTVLPTPTVTPQTEVGIATALTLPAGEIAFSFYNPAPNREVYEIHLLNLASGKHTRWPVDGVSEPALHHTESEFDLAFRSWGKPNNPRSLVSSSFDETTQHQIGGFWEDAHPDWSPAEDRLIYASQREPDRRWRLYTSLASGGDETPLLLEGHSPSFAPDGDRLVYVACDDSANNCGLWQTALSTLTANPVLGNPSASAPDWSPTGERIAYMAQLEGNWDLYLTNSAGSIEQRLTSDPAIEGLPVWSPDGTWLAYLSDKGGDWGIWLMQVESGETLQVFTFDGGTFNPPHEEPYGEREWWDEQLSWR